MSNFKSRCLDDVPIGNIFDRNVRSLNYVIKCKPWANKLSYVFSKTLQVAVFFFNTIISLDISNYRISTKLVMAKHTLSKSRIHFVSPLMC